MKRAKAKTASWKKYISIEKGFAPEPARWKKDVNVALGEINLVRKALKEVPAPGRFLMVANRPGRHSKQVAKRIDAKIRTISKKTGLDEGTVWSALATLTLYKGFERKKGRFSESKVGRRVTLKRPLEKPPLALESEKLTIKEMEQEHKKLRKAGLSPPKIKARIGKFVEGKKLAEQEMDTLVLRTWRKPTYNDLVANIDKIGEIIDKGSREKLNVDPRVENLGFDKKGKLGLLDFYPVYEYRDQRFARHRNIQLFIASLERDFNARKAKKIKSLLLKELDKIERERKKRNK